ncbi:type III secretion system export apparatus subunit SctT [Paraburkholderia unamae]|uniref:Type III secretion system export apparatus subunit SctT n=1 Tax=Paraburkholderia unamae TaxID=219649 RepID=A0ACC6RVM7_9BURK
MAALPPFVELIDGYLLLTGLCALRLFVIFYIFPPTGDTVLQGLVRTALVLLFSAYVAYGQPRDFIGTLHGALLVEVGMRETLIGLVIGFAASVVFWVAEGAGTYIDGLNGYNNVQISNPTRPETDTPTAALLGHMAITAFWAFGGMTFLLGVVYESYNWWPVSAASPNVPNIVEAFTMRETDTLMQLVAKLAAPMMLILLLIDFAFAFAVKSAAKFDLMTLSQPVKGAMTVLMLALFVGLFVDEVKDQLILRDFSVRMRALSQKVGAGKPDAVSGAQPPAVTNPVTKTQYSSNCHRKSDLLKVSI